MPARPVFSPPCRALSPIVAALAGVLAIGGPLAADTLPVRNAPVDTVTYERQESPGVVTLEVQPTWDGESLVFDIAANTHTADLSEIRLARQLTLSVDGRSLEPDSAGELQGHHGQTRITFRLPERPDSFALVIRDVPDVPHRQLTWRPDERPADDSPGSLVVVGGIAPGSLAIVDPGTLRIVHLVEGLQAVHGAGVSADGRRAFALNMADSAAAVSVIETETGTIRRVVSLPGPGHHAAPDPGEDRLYVAYGTMGLDEGAPRGVASVDPATGDVRVRPLDGTPFYVTVARDGSTLYAAVTGTDRLVALGLPDLEVQGEAALSGAPSHVVMSPDGRSLFVALTEGRVAKIEARSLEVVAEAETAPDAHAVALAGDPARLFVANRGSGTITVLDPESLERLADLELVELPIHLLESPSGTLLVSAGGSRELVEIDPRDLRVLRRLSLPFQPHQSGHSK